MFKIKSILKILFFTILFSFFVSANIFAENQIFLENLPGLENLGDKARESFKDGKDGGGTVLKTYINWMIKTSVIIGSILAVAFIIYGGIKYMTSVAFSGKSEGREHLTNAIGGLIFLIGGYIIFLQINPNILSLDFNASAIKVDTNTKSQNIELSYIENSGSSHGYGGNVEYDNTPITGNAQGRLTVLNEEGAKYGINNNLEKAHFLAQVAHESANFTVVRERGYTLSRAKEVFPSKYYYCLTEDNPVSIFNCVYGGRLGNTEPGDGNKYRGRGLIQITGKTNYRMFMEFHNRRYPGDIDFVSNPNLVSQSPYASRSALWFWSSHGCGSRATGDTLSDVKSVTRCVNGGLNGIDDRWKRFQSIYAKLK